MCREFVFPTQAAERGEHVREAGLVLPPVPRAERKPHVRVAVLGVPQHGPAIQENNHRGRALDRQGQPVGMVLQHPCLASEYLLFSISNTESFDRPEFRIQFSKGIVK